MATLQEIDEAIKLAHKDGDEASLLKLIEARDRVAPSSGPRPTEKSGLVERARDIGMDPQQLFVEPHTKGELFRAGLDKTLEDVPLGLAQLATLGQSDKINETIAERNRAYYEGGLADSEAGKAGALTGTVTGAFLPGGVGAKFGGRVAANVPSKFGPAIEGGFAGMAEGLAMPVEGDFLTGKAQQAGVGAGLGAGAATGMDSLIRGGYGLANAPRRAYNAPNNLLAGAVDSGSPTATAGRDLAVKHGVGLTPGQASGNRALQFAEQRARESFASAGRVARGDLIRAQQLEQAIANVAGDASSPAVANELQGRLNNFVRDLAKSRSKFGRQAYGAIDEFAGNRPIIRADNVRTELQAIVDEAGTQTTGDVAKAARQARRMLEEIPEGDITRGQVPQGYTGKEALSRLQSWSSHSQGNVFDDVSRGYDSVLKRRLHRALMEDMSAAEVLGDNLGDMVKRANAGWREFSNQIESVEKSALGRMVGREFANDLMNFNTVAPEKIFDQLGRMKPSQMRYTVDFMQRNMPDMLPQVRGGMLNDAIDAALMGPPSGGADFMFNPNQFLSALGLRSGKGGVEGMKRLEAMFGAGTREWSEVQELIEIARRMGDAYGRNFSGTSQANQFFRMLRDFAGTGINVAKRIGSTAMEMGGLRRIAETMEPGNINFGNLQRKPLLEPPRVLKRTTYPAAVTAPALQGEPQRQ